MNKGPSSWKRQPGTLNIIPGRELGSAELGEMAPALPNEHDCQGFLPIHDSYPKTLFLKCQCAGYADDSGPDHDEFRVS